MDSGYKTVRYSKTTITELMIPSYANFGGKIHGGILLSLMADRGSHRRRRRRRGPRRAQAAE